MIHTRGTSVMITGGSRGIGFATAQAFLERGARVAVCARDPDRLQAALDRLGAQGEVCGESVDVRDPASVEAFVAHTIDRLGSLDVLINNAGVVWAGAYAEQDYDSIAAVIDSNVKGVMYVARAVLPHMLRAGRGVIVNLSSGAGLTGFPGVVAYSSSKFAVVGFTESLDQEVGPHGIRVYGLCPGRVATDMQREYSGEITGMAPEQVADRIVRLVEGRTRARTGRCLTL